MAKGKNSSATAVAGTARPSSKGEATAQDRKDAKENKKERKPRVVYPGLECDQEGRATKKLDKIPDDYDAKVHLPLRRQDFTNEAPLLEWRADRLQKKVDRLRKEAEDARKGGSRARRAKMAKMARVLAGVAKIRADLKAEGLTDEQIDAICPAPKAELSQETGALEKVADTK